MSDTTSPLASSSFWLTSTNVVVGNELKPAGVFVNNGVIEKVTSREEALKEANVVDYGDLCLMQGLVDSHVHVNEPGRVEWEGYVSATKAATAGGVTTIVDMPLNSSPVTTTLKALEVKIASLDGKLWCDVGLLGGIVPGNENEIIPMIERGVVGFKCFMVFSGIDEFPNVNEKEILLAMQKFKQAERPVIFMFHAEAPDVLEEAENNLKKIVADPTAYKTFLSSRPGTAEEKAIQTVIKLCNQTGVRSHIVHLSAASALDLLKEAQSNGIKISAETTPHYLSLISEEVENGNTLFKCCPPIRPKENREQLWEGVKNNVISLIASDHSPCNVELKNLNSGDFGTAWGGIGSLQLVLPIIWTQAKERNFSIPQIGKLLSTSPAELVGLQKKGLIKVGNDADFSVWDPNASFQVTEDILFMKNTKIPYLGKTLFGKVKLTILRGKVVFEDGKHSVDPLGKWVK